MTTPEQLTPEQAAAQRAFAEATAPVTLFQLVESMRAILARVDDADGEVTPEVAAELDALAPTIERKVEAYAGVYRKLEADASANAALAEHYTRRKERLMRQREELKQRLFDGLRAMGLNAVKAPTGSASIQPSTPKLIVHDEAKAMESGWRKVVESVDKQALKAFLESLPNEETRKRYAFAELQQGQHLRIR